MYEKILFINDIEFVLHVHIGKKEKTFLFANVIDYPEGIRE